jgi:hypothetical protein
MKAFYRLGSQNIQYIVNNNKTPSMLGALVDGGANGGVDGYDVSVVETSFCSADIQTIQGLPIALVAALMQT